MCNRNVAAQKRQSMVGIPELRRELDAAMKIQEYSAYQKRLDELQEKFGHNIGVMASRGDFNCFAYAFGLSDHPDFVTLVHRTRKTAVMNSEFVVELLKRNQLDEIGATEVTAGDIALYSVNGKLTHAATIRQVRPVLILESKWGPSELHSHGLFEVPASYGDDIQFFKPTDIEEILDALRQRENSTQKAT
jgi:hypothetical protein